MLTNWLPQLKVKLSEFRHSGWSPVLGKWVVVWMFMGGRAASGGLGTKEGARDR